MSAAPDTVEAVYADLLARAPENRMEPRMEPMRRVLALLGDPQHAAPVIHLTGTNGKTSTARMIEAVLRAYGLRTGRYTSPHLRSVTERISIDELYPGHREVAVAVRAGEDDDRRLHACSIR